MPRTVLIVTRSNCRDGGLVRSIRSAGLECEVSSEASIALRQSAGDLCDLVLLDADAFGSRGPDLMKALRSSDAERPIIVLGSPAEIGARLAAFANGADDYVVKPFDARELMARVQALLRRVSTHKVRRATRLSFGDIVIDLVTGTALKGGLPVALSTRELQLLHYLAAHSNSIVSREELLTRVWGYVSVNTRTVDMHVASVRRKIEDDPQRPRYIVTVRGRGYRLMTHALDREPERVSESPS